MIDTHTHIYVTEFDEDRDEVVRRAQDAGVEQLLLPAVDSESHQTLFSLVRRYPTYCRAMMGLHPTSVNDNPSWREELARVESLLDTPPEGIGGFCGVGEIGLDLYWSRDWEREQIEAFRAQLDMALYHSLPVVIHTRDAWQLLVDTISDYKGRGLRGVFHAYSSDVSHYNILKELGDFRFGIGGVVTFKNSALARVVAEMKLEDLVLETDSPYLTPVPKRGRRNESAYVGYICSAIAQIKGVSEELVDRVTTESAKHIFNTII